MKDLEQSRALLEKAFYQSLDTSRILSVWRQQEKAAAQGEGRHFRCFRVPGDQGLAYALLVAKPSFMNGLASQRRHWACQLRRLLTASHHPLLPPMELLEEKDGQLAYIQPYGDEEQPLDQACKPLLAEFHQQLRELELEIDDYPQLRRSMGHPFVIDYSDLRALSRL